MRHKLGWIEMEAENFPSSWFFCVSAEFIGRESSETFSPRWSTMEKQPRSFINFIKSRKALNAPLVALESEAFCQYLNIMMRHKISISWMESDFYWWCGRPEKEGRGKPINEWARAVGFQGGCSVLEGKTSIKARMDVQRMHFTMFLLIHHNELRRARLANWKILLSFD